MLTGFILPVSAPRPQNKFSIFCLPFERSASASVVHQPAAWFALVDACLRVHPVVRICFCGRIKLLLASYFSRRRVSSRGRFLQHSCLARFTHHLSWVLRPNGLKAIFAPGSHSNRCRLDFSSVLHQVSLLVGSVSCASLSTGRIFGCSVS
jgi:hypothetical protein